ncbi:MAG TPA: ribose-phosphate diphosphokinase [Planctomycetaceae bacterium]|nr:ribose-phosphate diphosphokinase [Planctomycetaceae bacterium]
MNDLKIFSGRANAGLAKSICDYLGIDLGTLSVGNFPDGETHAKIEQDVRGQDIFIVQPTCPPVNENLMELLILIDSFKRASADRVTAVIPYFGYARQDRKDEGRVPITAKMVANLLTRAGADRILTMDLHAAQIQGFFDIPVDHLTAAPVLDDHFRRMAIPPDRLVVASPDEGSIKRVLLHVDALGGSLVIIDKRRFGNRTEQANLIGGPIEGKIVLIFDDMISTAGSICGAARLVKRYGAEKVYLAATHGVLCGNALENIRNAPIENILLTDTIPLPVEMIPNLTVMSVAPLLGEAIRRIHCHESVSRLFRELPLWTGR